MRRPETPGDAQRRQETPRRARVCLMCGGKVEADPLNLKCLTSTGVPACKACIDVALAARFGPFRRVSFLDSTYD